MSTRFGAMLPIAATFGLFWAGAAAAACPENSQMIGVVEAIHGARGTIRVQRAATTILPAVAMPLCAHDMVNIAPGADLGVKMFDGHSVHFNAGAHEIAPAQGANMFQRVLQEKLEAFAPTMESYSHNLVGRDAKPVTFAFTLDSLNGGHARLSPGWTTVWLSWVGGVGPYSVSLKGPSATPVQIDNVLDKQVALPVGQLQPGQWSAAVTDLTGRAIQASFTVDGGQARPPMAEGPFAEIDDAVTAVSLAGQPELAFEAQQVISNAPAQGLDRAPIYLAIACKAGASAERALCTAPGATAATP